MDLAEHIAKVLQEDQAKRYEARRRPANFWDDWLECEIFNAIQDLRADSKTHKAGNRLDFIKVD